MSLPSDAGVWLREARERKGLTLDDLAHVTKISPKVLFALEAGATDKLPPTFFTRGFVKAYAKEVGLDPDGTADRYLAEVSPDTPVADAENVRALVETAVSRTGVIGFENRHAPLLTARRSDRSGRLILAAAAIGAVVYLGRLNWDSYASPADAVSPGPAPATAAEPPRAELAAASDVSNGPLKVEIKPQGACWFSAAADGNPAQSELLQAGATRPIEVRDALVLRVGDADACAFTINGHAGRAPGSPGAPVTVRITKDNFRDFVLRGL